MKLTMYRFIYALALIFCSSVTSFVTTSAGRSIARASQRHDQLLIAEQLRSRRGGGRPSPRPCTASTLMRYVAMNRFKVKLGCEDDFEAMWRSRESKLPNFSGFKEFMLLKVDHGDEGPEEGESNSRKAGFTEYISHTIWAHQLDYEEWRRSGAFAKSHGGGGGSEGKPSFNAGMSTMGDLMVERPSPTLYNAVIIEPTPPEHSGGLFEFENEPSYFDGDM